MSDSSQKSVVRSQTRQRPKARKPLGVVTPLTDEEIAALATITPDDIERAKREVIPELAALLNTKPMGRKRGTQTKS